MNNKESKLHAVVDAVVHCCETEIAPGQMSITAEDVLGKSRAENVVLTRQIVAMQLSHAGYTNTTIAQLLGCTAVRARTLIHEGYENLKNRRAFQFAYAEATLRVREIIS